MGRVVVDEENRTLSGYFCVFEEECVGDWIERIERTAMARAIAEYRMPGRIHINDTVQLVESMRIGVDPVGATIATRLHPVHIDFSLLRDARWGFTFKVPYGGDQWSENFSHRVITKLKLYDIAVCNA